MDFNIEKIKEYIRRQRIKNGNTDRMYKLTTKIETFVSDEGMVEYYIKSLFPRDENSDVTILCFSKNIICTGSINSDKMENIKVQKISSIKDVEYYNDGGSYAAKLIINMNDGQSITLDNSLDCNEYWEDTYQGQINSIFEFLLKALK